MIDYENIKANVKQTDTLLSFDNSNDHNDNNNNSNNYIYIYTHNKIIICIYKNSSNIVIIKQLYVYTIN